MIKKNTLMEKFNTEVQTGTAKRLFITKGAGRARCCDLRRLAADVLEGETLAPAAQESPREPRVRTTEAFMAEENNPKGGSKKGVSPVDPSAVFHWKGLKRECPLETFHSPDPPVSYGTAPSLRLILLRQRGDN